MEKYEASKKDYKLKKEKVNKLKLLNRSSFLCVLVNMFLMFIKLIFGMYFNSTSMIADGINSIDDVISSSFAYIGIKMKNKSRKFNMLNTKKTDYIISLIISIIMVFMSLTIFKSAINSFIYRKKIVYNVILVVVCLVTFVLKVLLYFYTRYVYIKTNNVLVLSLKIDCRNDILIIIGILISILFAKYDFYIVETIFSLVIGILILVSGLKLLKKSYDVLNDKELNNKKIFEIKKLIYEFDEIEIVDDILSNKVGDKYLIIIKLKFEENDNKTLSG